MLFWALDRVSREGKAQTILHLQRLSSYGVAFHSYTEAHLVTDNELVRNVLLALSSRPRVQKLTTLPSYLTTSLEAPPSSTV